MYVVVGRCDVSLLIKYSLGRLSLDILNTKEGATVFLLTRLPVTLVLNYSINKQGENTMRAWLLN